MADKKVKVPNKKDQSPKKGGTAKIYEAQNKYTDRAEEEKKQFLPLKINVQEPETLVLLLASKEREIILRSLNHLNKFAEKHTENAQKLYNFKIIEQILVLNLWNNEFLFIKRFALKLIAEIFQLDNVEFDENIIQQLYTISRDLYVNAMDDFIVEYSSAILQSCLREPRICNVFEEDIEFVNTIFKHIKGTDDPDILYNSYRIFIKLFQCCTSVLHLCDIDTFPFERVLQDISSEYTEIQNAALDTFAEMVECKNDFYQTRFVCPKFFEELFKILENDLWLDRHLAIINVLRRLMSYEKITKSFCRSEYLPRFINYIKQKDPYKIEALGVAVEIAQYEDHLEYLNLLSVVKELLNFLKDIDKVNVDICLGLNRMTKNSEAMIRIINEDPIPYILKIISDNEKDFTIKGSATDILTTLLKRNFKMCESAIKNDISKIISRILKQNYGSIPVDFLLQLIHTLIILAKDPEIREQIMTDELAASLVQAFKNFYRSSILIANLFNCATAYICENKLANEFLNNSMTTIILQGLKSLAVIVKNAVADFIVVTGKIQKFADEYINSDVLEYLLNDDVALSTCPNWSLAIEAILSTNPAIKFSIRGRLEITDITGEDFSVSKHHWKDFKVFKSLLTEDVSPFYPIFIINFDNTEVPPEFVQRIKIVYSDLNIPVEPIKPEKSEVFDWEDEWIYCRKPADKFLPKYLERLRNVLEARNLIDSTNISNSIDITKIADRVKIVAEIVSSEMCGTKIGAQSEICSESAVIKHLNELKCDLHCSIIPLGHVRFGGHFERAILFKALADHIGLPATLVKGVDGKILYNEVPLPEQAEKSECGLSILPMRLLTPTHIVDLMDSPGELYPLQSRKSYSYQRLL